MTVENDVVEGGPAACRALAEAVRRVPRAPRVRRVEVQAPPVDVGAWLHAQPPPRGFWKGRDAQAAHAFAGVADRSEDPARLCARLTRHADHAPAAPLRYYGGVRFDAGRPAEDGWQHFGAGAFVLPRFELTGPGEGPARLACHLAPDDDVEAVAEAAEAQASGWARAGFSSTPALPNVTQRRDAPPRPLWKQGVRRALAAFERGALQKVVLARRTTLRFGASLDPVALLGHLRALAPTGFAFLMQPARAGAFLGVSPERLFRQRGRRVWSEAVAGTRPRARAAEADAALQEELLQSEKDRREHALVQRYIRDALQPLCTSLEGRAAAPLTLRRGRHLYARFEGRLREGTTPAEVLRVLHPTPAVGGVPPAPARRFIRENEPFDRGWYAAPVGWLGVEGGAPAAELAVAIRSGLVQRSRGEGPPGEHPGEGRLDLFAGAGLVNGSEADAEWNEVEQKLGNFAALFEQEAGAPRAS